jgi:hypothetical protein
MGKLAPTHSELKKQSKLAADLIPANIWDGIHKVNEKSYNALTPMWQENIRANLSADCFKNQMGANELTGLGTDKAVIAVGAGPSLKNNIDVLKEISDICIESPNLDMQPFIIIASNHMYKPLLEKDIHPHFVMLVDGGDATYDQLCKDVPKKDKTILLAPLQIHPTIRESWIKQGRSVVWFHSMDDDAQKIYREYRDDDPKKIQLVFGGNVLNCMWALAIAYLKSKIYICVGNDLCFPREGKVKDKRKAFYVTGNYEVNIKNKRDEARSHFAWMGFGNLRRSSILDTTGRPVGHPTYDFNLVNMSHSHFTYKIWAESQIMLNADAPISWQYFNCSEGGSLGVMSKGDSPEEMEKDDNWYLLDDKMPLRYRTRRLEDTVWQYLKARAMVSNQNAQGILTGAKSAGILHHGTSTAPPAGTNSGPPKIIH